MAGVFFNKYINCFCFNVNTQAVECEITVINAWLSSTNMEDVKTSIKVLNEILQFRLHMRARL